MRQRAEHMNRNSGFPTFGVIALIENGHFHHTHMSALYLKNCLRYFHETSYKFKA